jgi:anti-sigma factor RsiW
MDRIQLHPSERDLLLFADGELPKNQAGKIEVHLASCWDCRARLAETEGTIKDFVTLRRKVLDRWIHDASLPSARTARTLLRARLADMGESSRTPGWRRISATLLPSTFNRSLWIGGAFAALVVALLMVEPFLSPSVSAMEVIAKARAAENRRPQGAVIHQRVRVRRKQKAARSEAAVDCDLWTNGVRTRMVLASDHADPADQLRAVYQKYGADWDSPLSATSFAKFRDSMGNVRDDVSGKDEITVASTPSAGERSVAELQKVAVTVRRADWHAVAQRIELRDADYELTELLDEAVDRDKVDPAIFGEPRESRAASSVAAPHEAEIVPPLPPAPTSQQLNEAEIRLREAFHQTGADVEEVPEIEQADGHIRYRLFTQTTRRKEEILTALAEIPFLVPDIYDAEARAIEAPTANPPAPGGRREAQLAVYSAQPPLSKALREYSGGLEPANNYMNAVRDAYLSVLVDASALARLADRYPEADWVRLSSEMQERLNRIAEDHIAAVRSNWTSFLLLVSPVLDEMLAKQQLNIAAEAEPTDPGCSSWRTFARPFVTDLTDLQTSFRRLFVEDQTEKPVTLSATDLLRQSALSQSRLRNKVKQLCQP